MRGSPADIESCCRCSDASLSEDKAARNNAPAPELPCCVHAIPQVCNHSPRVSPPFPPVALACRYSSDDALHAASHDCDSAALTACHALCFARAAAASPRAAGLRRPLACHVLASGEQVAAFRDAQKADQTLKVWRGQGHCVRRLLRLLGPQNTRLPAVLLSCQCSLLNLPPALPVASAPSPVDNTSQQTPHPPAPLSPSTGGPADGAAG